jgi:hypothetical protein
VSQVEINDTNRCDVCGAPLYEHWRGRKCIEGAKSEIHPLDEPLGYFHELAIRLEMAGCSEDAVKVASAYEKIRAWVLAKEKK